jgi:hypothetical protein
MNIAKTSRSHRVRNVAAAVLGAALLVSSVAAAVPATARHAQGSAVQRAKARSNVFFHSPSENIYCDIFGFRAKANARCDISERSWPAPHRPRTCHLDYGNGTEVGPHGKGRFTCAGDTILGQGHRVLRYGHSAKLGAIKCTSRRNGMTCRNVETDHGFALSREAVDFF